MINRLKNDPTEGMFDEGTEDVNPMDYINNLADVMLVLAVGMMLALVVAWNLDLVGIGDKMSSVHVEGRELIEDPEDMSGTEGERDPEDYGLTEYGTVYIDENGDLFILDED